MKSASGQGLKLLGSSTNVWISFLSLVALILPIGLYFVYASNAACTTFSCYAQKEIGVAENPANSNCTKYSGTGSGCSSTTKTAKEAWCADFVSWVYKTTGYPFTGGLVDDWRINNVLALKTWFVKNATYHHSSENANPVPGDVLILIWSSKSQHTAIVTSVSGGTIYTVDGNGRDNNVKATSYSRADPYLDGWGHVTTIRGGS